MNLTTQNIFDWVLKDNISPNKEFYYKIQYPQELNKAAFGCKIAFYDKFDQLIYFQENTVAHELNDPEDIKRERELVSEKRYNELLPHDHLRIATWSIQGNMAYILEYHKENMKAIYQDVFIDLKGKFVIQLPLGVISDETISELHIRKDRFDENVVTTILNNLNIVPISITNTESYAQSKTKIFSGKWYE